MYSTAENVRQVVAILTAILSDQEEIANQLLVESDPIELFGSMTGILLSVLVTLAEQQGQTVEQLLYRLGMSAFKNS
jgi:hypothetical protein